MNNKIMIKNGLDLDDIRAIRTANAERYEKMTTAEIIEDINVGAKECLARMEAIRLAKKEAV